MDKLEELMANPTAALLVTITGYACAFLGIAGGFRLLYMLVSGR